MERETPAGQSAIVLGATAPAASAVALALARSGLDVAVTSATADPQEAFELRRLSRALAEGGRRALVESVDLSNGASVQVAVRQVARQLGAEVRVVVIAADTGQQRPSERLNDADYARIVNGNLGAVFFACRAAWREMQPLEPDQHGVRGRILALLPSQLNNGQAGPALYTAARVGVQALLRALADEWRGQAVAVNGIVIPAGASETDTGEAVAATALRLLTTALTGEVVAARRE